VSGGNIDVTILSRVITRGLLMSGRCCQLLIELQDKPGQLSEVTNIIAGLGGNITTVHHERSNSGLAINGCYLRVELETRNHEHIEEIRQGLRKFGFKLID
jgi:threonine dehydratase